MRNSFLFNKDIPIDSAYYYVREIAKAMTPSIWGKLSRLVLAGILFAIFVNAATVMSAMGQTVPVVASSSGIWTSVTGGSSVTGVNTNEVRWGVPAETYQSGLRFDGQSVIANTGEEFCLGKLTHYNYPVYYAASGAELQITLAFTSPAITPAPQFTYTFVIDETTNPYGGVCGSTGCPYSPCETIPCPDQLSWPSTPPSGGTFQIGSDTYTLQIVGIKDSCPNGNLKTSWVTQERKSNVGYLVGKLILTRPAIKIVKTTNGQDADSIPGPTILTGCPVTWTYTVTNAGNAALRDVSVTDSPVQTISYVSGDTHNTGWLDIDETWVYQATGTAVSGQYSNIATARGRKDTSSAYVSNTNPSNYYGQILSFAGPSSLTVCQGNPAAFSVVLTPVDSGQYNYQWQSSSNSGSTWNDITGATSSSYTVASAPYVTPSMQYKVRVALKTQPTCWKDSNPATLTVKPTISLTAPSPTTVCDGGTASFSVTPNDPAYTYQWQVNSGSGWGDVTTGTGGATAQYSFTAAYADNGKQYRVVVGYASPPSCPVTSSAALLTVKPTISLTGPSPTTVCDGGTASFSVTPNPAYTYQWQVNSGSGWGDVTTGTGGTTAQYSFTAAYADNGKQYRVAVGYVSSPSCPVTSSAALLTVRPTISLDCPDDVSLCNGGTATFTVTPNPVDEGQYQYQWDVSTDGGTTWTPITTAIGPTYSFTASLADNGNKYRVTVKYNTMPYCEASPCIATLTVQGGSTVTVGSSMTICVEDGPITLSGTATNAQSAKWSVESGGDYGEVTSNSYNPTTGSVTAVFTPKSSGDFSDDVVVKLTATPKSPCSGDVSNTQTVTVVQKPSIHIVVIQPPAP